MSARAAGVGLAMVAGSLLAQSPSPTEHADVFAFVRALDEVGARHLWPGFNPAELPIALFDGEKTVLLRHPQPPAEFSPMPGRTGALVSPGRYPGVIANSTREIGGVRTATVVMAPGHDPRSTLLACIEETFHVFWLARHPAFRPNEMTRYAYPIKDLENLRRLLAEDEALARALDSEAEREAAGWAMAALQVRRERSSRRTEDECAYETSLEMMEGTANCVARRAVDETLGQTAARLRMRRPAEGIRWRFYDTGTALCLLLDRFDPTWKTQSDSRTDLTMVEILEPALARRGAKPSVFSTTETEGFRTRAALDVEDLAGRQDRLRRELLARSGPRVILEVADGAEPFRVERFDPINLSVLDGGEVVHAHFITLRSRMGSVELTNPGHSRGSFAGTVGLTASAGRHPLSDGIRQLTIVGIQGTLQVVHNGTIELDAPGLRIQLEAADVQTDGETTRITLPSQRSPGPPGSHLPAPPIC